MSSASKLRAAAAKLKAATPTANDSSNDNSSTPPTITSLHSAVAALQSVPPSSYSSSSSSATSNANIERRRETKTNKLKTAALALKLTSTTTQWGEYNHLLNTDISNLSNERLKQHLKARNEHSEGTKSELIERLQTSIEKERQEKIAIELELETKHREIADEEEKGALYGCGKNNVGQLGLGNDDDHLRTFTVIPSTRGKFVQHLSVGGDTALATTKNHEVYSWGGYGVGMGLPNTLNNSNHNNRMTATSWSTTPQFVTKLNGEEITSTAIGANHACAVSKGNDLFVWGLINNNTQVTQPQYFDTVTATSIACGEMHTCIKTNENEVYTFGYGGNGRLGREYDVGNQFTPLPVHLPSASQTVKFIACGAEHTLLSTQQSAVYSFGCGDGGRLGLGDVKDRLAPCEISTLKGSNILSLSAGTWHSACVVHMAPLQEESGWLYTWGTGFVGQLGLGRMCQTCTPTIVQDFIDKGLSIKQIYCGSHHNAAIANDGNLYTWGSNQYGALGRQSIDARFTPHPGIVAEFGTIVDRIGRGLPLR